MEPMTCSCSTRSTEPLEIARLHLVNGIGHGLIVCKVGEGLVKSIKGFPGYVEVVTDLDTLKTPWHNVAHWVDVRKPPAKKKANPVKRRKATSKSKSRKAKA